MKRLLSSLSLVSVLLFGVLVASPTPADAAVMPLSSVTPGSLVKGVSLPAVSYYGVDGFRYVFPNSATYFTWYDNFSSVVTISDADLSSIQIGGNVTYRPGVRMIKINTAPKTYAVGSGGALHWVTSEEVAIALYGADWNKKIDDVPDAFFGNYYVSTDITSGSQFSPSSATSSATNIGSDRGLMAPKDVVVSSQGFAPDLITVSAGQGVRWTNNDTVNHTATSDNLDWGSGTIAPGINFIRRFKQPGTYTYFDSYHSQFTGTVIVQ
ncbi:MAG: Copper-binding protein, plastocyanin/azurin family [Parcubacteria group bacterium GW2011_GWA2_56_7]|nr:MAG: Copper-binding protein, plastocyanin/azurin family [Parcubacteria group bacterium GW2011_GWA2_56_7]